MATSGELAVDAPMELQDEEVLRAAHKQLEGMRQCAYRVFAVISFLTLAPYLLVAFAVMQLWRHLYLGFSRWLWPDLDIVTLQTVRSLMDTRRSQALLTAVVCLRTPVDIDVLRSRVKERLVDQFSAAGQLAYPRLRCMLTTACGRYAWREEDDFQVEPHVVQAQSLPARDLDHPWAQQAASDVTAKFLAHDLAPWQVALLPGGRLVVVRLHHLLQAEGPRLLDVVSAVCAAGLLQEDDEMPPPALPPAPVAPPPLLRALPGLSSALRQAGCSVLWAAVSAWEPRPGAAPEDPAAVFAVAARAWADADKNMGHEHKYDQGDFLERAKARGLTAAALAAALTPFGLLLACVRVWWWLAVSALLRLPLSAALQVLQLVVRGRRSRLATYWRLCGAAAAELRWLLLQLLDGPVALLRERLRAGNASAHSLRVGSFTGRKVVSWSARVALPQGVGADGASLLSAVSLSLRAYFESLQQRAFEDVPCHLPERVLCLASMGHQPGLLGVPLPTNPSCDYAAPGNPQAAETLRQVRMSLRRAGRRQQVVRRLLRDDCALLRLLPSFAARVLLNAASRSYPVRVSIVPSSDQLVPAAEELLLWRPPQGNVCLSLSLLLEECGKACRLAVMADAFVSPHHAAITDAFPDAMHTIIDVLEFERHQPTLRSASSSSSSSSTPSSSSPPSLRELSPPQTPPPSPQRSPTGSPPPPKHHSPSPRCSTPHQPLRESVQH